MSWLKIENVTPSKLEIFEMAGELGIDPDAVLGKLVRVWIWFDGHTEDGHVSVVKRGERDICNANGGEKRDMCNASVTLQALLDREAGVTGFCKAMINCGWLAVNANGGITLPNFDYHNSQTAKARALTQRRQANRRTKNSKCNANEGEKRDMCNANDTKKRDACHESVTRGALPDKIREEYINPHTPFPAKGGNSKDSDQKPETVREYEESLKAIIPKGARKKPKRDKGKIKCLKNHPHLERLGSLWGRDKDTMPSVLEAEALMLIRPTEEEIEMISKYYQSNAEFKRNCLATALNNWPSELDKARAMTGGKKPDNKRYHRIDQATVDFNRKQREKIEAAARESGNLPAW